MGEKPYTRFNAGAGAVPETMMEIAPHQFVTKAFYDKLHGKTAKPTRPTLSNDSEELPANEAGQERLADRREQDKGGT